MIETAKSLALTFYSRPFYEKLVLRQKGFGVRYILWLALFSLIGFCVAGYPAMRDVIHNIEAGFAAMPDTRLKGGILSIDKPVPFTVNFGSEKKPFKLVFDTDYKIENHESAAAYMREKGIGILATADNAAIRRSFDPKDVDVDEFDDAHDGVYTHNDWASAGKIIVIFFYPVLVVGAALLALAGMTVLTLVMAAIVKLLALILRMRAGFEDTVRIAAALGIPAGIVTAIAPVGMLLKILLWAGYGFFALAAAKKAPGRTR